MYQKELSDRHALDFADLVFYTRSMLHLLPEVAELNRTARGALIEEAIRFWYAHLDGDDGSMAVEVV